MNRANSKGPSGESDEDDPAIIARIKELETGKKGFTAAEMAKVKYLDNLDEVKDMPLPANPKLDTGSETTQDTVYGPRDLNCPCCESEIE
jgi:hypothetical protein